MISFKKIKLIWNDYSFELILGCSIVLILLLSLWRKFKGKRGTWAKSYFYDPFFSHKYKKDITHQQHQRRPFQSKGEVECRRVLMKIFDKPFNSCRPRFFT